MQREFCLPLTMHQDIVVTSDLFMSENLGKVDVPKLNDLSPSCVGFQVFHSFKYNGLQQCLQIDFTMLAHLF